MAKPTHDLVICRRDDKKIRTKAGVAWQNAKGWIEIRLSPGVVLDWRDGETVFLNLYPREDRPDDDKDEQKGDW